MRQITWLHISDLHIKDGDPYDRNNVLDALVRYVTDEKQHSRRAPDIIFATGDIAHSGKHSEYQRATTFFDELLEAAGLDKSRLFVIPGNHDVERSKGLMLVRTLPDHQTAVDFFADPYKVNQYLAKQQEYREWYGDYFSGVRDLTASTTCDEPRVLEVNGLRISIACINSALFSQDEHDHNKLWIGRRCIDCVAKEIVTADPEIRFALVHHPLEWIHDGEQSSIKAALNDIADFILRGHLHEVEILKIAGSHGEAMHLATGAAYQGSSWPNRAIYGRADYESGEVMVYPLRYEDTPRPVWTLDTSVFPGNVNYEGRFRVTWKHKSPLDSGGSTDRSVQDIGGDVAANRRQFTATELDDDALRILRHSLDQGNAPSVDIRQAVRDALRDEIPDLLEPLVRQYTGMISMSEQRAAADSDATLNSQIDDLRNLILQGKAASAKVKLLQLRTEHDGKLSQHMQFRIASNLGACFWELDEFDSAAIEVDRALTLEPDNPKAIANAALVALLNEENDKAIELTTTARSMDQRVDNGASVYIQACARLGRMDDVERLERTEVWILADPHCTVALAVAYLNAGRHGEAERLARTATALMPGNPHAYLILAQAILAPAQTRINNSPPMRWRMDIAVIERAERALEAVNAMLEIVKEYE